MSDTAAARDFYVDVLGFTELERPDFGFPGAWLEIGEQQIHLQELDMPDQMGQHFALTVVDIDSAVAALRERGVDVDDPREIDGVCRQTFFSDPSGNRIEFNQPLSP